MSNISRWNMRRNRIMIRKTLWVTVKGKTSTLATGSRHCPFLTAKSPTLLITSPLAFLGNLAQFSSRRSRLLIFQLAPRPYQENYYLFIGKLISVPARIMSTSSQSLGSTLEYRCVTTIWSRIHFKDAGQRIHDSSLKTD